MIRRGGAPPALYLAPATDEAVAYLVASNETRQMVEHVVIITHVIQHGSCPCPGIGDAALGGSDTVLHFYSNVLSFTGPLIAAAYVLPPWFGGYRAAGARLRLQ